VPGVGDMLAERTGMRAFILVFFDILVKLSYPISMPYILFRKIILNPILSGFNSLQRNKKFNKTFLVSVV